MRVAPERLSLMRERERAEVGERQRMPSWIRAPLPGGERYARIKHNLRERGLHTVCEEARCPNVGECWNEGTATLMLMGDACTRACRFCAVTTHPRPPPLDPAEPAQAAEQVRLMGLDYVVITSVNRDDLEDGGAGHFAATIRAVREANPQTLVEVLVPDFEGMLTDVDAVVDAQPHVFAHNVETVASLTATVRDRRASYATSLAVLQHARRRAAGRGDQMRTKSSIMLGLGETDAEVDATLEDLRAHEVDIVTLGQYLRPSAWHHPVERFVHPDEFSTWTRRCEELGFAYAACGPLVRSSYRAGEFYLRALVQGDKAAHAP